MAEPPSAITKLLAAWSAGDQTALDRLLPLVYAELRRVAHNRLRHERRDQTLQPTALVNEAHVRLVHIRRVKWQNRAHFFALCALMRQILVDAARARQSGKRGGGRVRVTVHEGLLPSDAPGSDVVALDDALKALADQDPRKSRVVELRFFAALNVEETAAMLGVSTDTVSRGLDVCEDVVVPGVTQ